MYQCENEYWAPPNAHASSLCAAQARALGSLSYNQAVLKVVKAQEAALLEEQLHRSVCPHSITR